MSLIDDRSKRFWTLEFLSLTRSKSFVRATTIPVYTLIVLKPLNSRSKLGPFSALDWSSRRCLGGFEQKFWTKVRVACIFAEVTLLYCIFRALFIDLENYKASILDLVEYKLTSSAYVLILFPCLWCQSLIIDLIHRHGWPSVLVYHARVVSASYRHGKLYLACFSDV